MSTEILQKSFSMKTLLHAVSLVHVPLSHELLMGRRVHGAFLAPTGSEPCSISRPGERLPHGIPTVLLGGRYGQAARTHPHLFQDALGFRRMGYCWVGQ